MPMSMSKRLLIHGHTRTHLRERARLLVAANYTAHLLHNDAS